MYDSNSANEVLEMIGQVLIRCFIMGVFLLFFWWGALVLTGDLAYSVHTKIAAMSRQQFDVIHYAGMLMTKSTIVVLFLFPYIAIRLVIMKRRR